MFVLLKITYLPVQQYSIDIISTDLSDEDRENFLVLFVKKN